MDLAGSQAAAFPMAPGPGWSAVVAASLTTPEPVTTDPAPTGIPNGVHDERLSET